MKMVKGLKLVKGITLIEAIVAMSILAIAAIGAMSYQYHGARHARIAREQITATRTAQLLLEDWKSYCYDGEVDKYDPTDLGLGFSEPLPIPPGLTYGEVPGNPLNDAIYTITVDGLPMHVMLKYSKIGYDEISEISLWELSVIIGFERIDGANGSPTSALENMPPLIMTTYGSNATSG
jgi:hypothetical protein